MTAPPAPTGEVTALVSHVQDGIGTIADAINATIDGINSVLHLLPPGFPIDGNRSAELERRLSNDTAFAGGAWPRSTTPISGDGSITDGDDTT